MSDLLSGVKPGIMKNLGIYSSIDQYLGLLSENTRYW